MAMACLWDSDSLIRIDSTMNHGWFGQHPAMAIFLSAVWLHEPSRFSTPCMFFLAGDHDRFPHLEILARLSLLCWLRFCNPRR